MAEFDDEKSDKAIRRNLFDFCSWHKQHQRTKNKTPTDILIVTAKHYILPGHIDKGCRRLHLEIAGFFPFPSSSKTNPKTITTTSVVPALISFVQPLYCRTELGVRIRGGRIIRCQLAGFIL